LIQYNPLHLHLLGRREAAAAFSGRSFSWTFLRTKVAFPIIGIDFLHHHRLQLDAVKATLFIGQLFSNFFSYIFEISIKFCVFLYPILTTYLKKKFMQNMKRKGKIGTETKRSKQNKRGISFV